ncbi:18553_t:CDS:1, partial [Racocetra persica]
KRQVDYELSEELKPYLKKERFNKISELTIDKEKELVRLYNLEPKLLKKINYRSNKNYLFLLQILYELLKINDKDLSDEVLFSMGRIFSTTENPIHDHIVASRYFKELVDDKSSKLRLQAAEAYANIIRVKAMGRLGGSNEALLYLEIAIDLKRADIYFAIYSVYAELGRKNNTSKYLKLAANMNYNLAIKK